MFKGNWKWLSQLKQRANSPFLHVFVLFRPPTGRCPPTLGRAICFTLPTNSSVNLFQKHLINTPRIMFYQFSGHPSAQLSNIKLTTALRLNPDLFASKTPLPGALYAVQGGISVKLLGTRAACCCNREAQPWQCPAEIRPSADLSCWLWDAYTWLRSFSDPLWARNSIKFDLSIWVATQRGLRDELWRKLI